jgi:preprotein translocase subunit SecD
MRKNPGLWLTVIIVVAIIAAIFVYPRGWGASARPWQLGLDLAGGAHLVYSIDLSQVSSTDQSSVVDGLRDVIEKRVNLFGVGEPQVYTSSPGAGQSGNTAELDVDLPGVKDTAQAVQQIGQTPTLDFVEVQTSGSSTTPQYVPTNLTGQYLTGATVGANSSGAGGYVINFTLNTPGAQIFDEMTKADVNKQICIFIDNNFIIPNSPAESCPTVDQEISNGQAQISGSDITFSVANQIAEQFNAGALPAPITLINQETVSPTLGGNSLEAIIVAGIIGTLLVILFMLFYYGRLGVFAALSLIIYIALALGLFKLVGITLSLAGLAGFILTIGMAVDANILIFERIKEELKRGLPRASAIEEGFRRAWPSIRDSNTSTIITALILYFFTSSFVQGFAVTLLLGVLVSLFSAITTTRLFLRIFLKDNGPVQKSMTAASLNPSH